MGFQTSIRTQATNCYRWTVNHLQRPLRMTTIRANPQELSLSLNFFLHETGTAMNGINGFSALLFDPNFLAARNEQNTWWKNSLKTMVDTACGEYISCVQRLKDFPGKSVDEIIPDLTKLLRLKSSMRKIGYAHWLLAKVSRLSRKSNQVNRAHYSAIAIACRNYRKTVNNMASFVSRGKYKLRYSENRLLELAENVRTTFPDNMKQINITIDETLRLMLDKTSIRIVFSNLIKNALEAKVGEQNDPDYITISAEIKRGLCYIYVSNKGKLIEPEDLKHMFQAYYTKGKNNGHGLGLAFSKYIIEKHGGSISVKSSPETGTVFTIILPYLNGHAGDGKQ